MSIASKIVERHIPCPACPSSDAFCLYDDGHGYCFSCQHFQPSRGTIPVEDFTYEFINYRGINKETFAFYNAKAKVSPGGEPSSIGFVYPFGAVKVRKLKTKDFYWTPKESHQPGCFGTDRFAAGSHKYIIITEGEYDALSYHQVLRSPCVSVQSSGSAVRDCRADYAWLNSFERIYIAFDNDSAGREATGRVAKLFDLNKVYHVKFTNRKDANDYLQLGEGEELRNLWHNSHRYLPENIVSSFSEFGRILKEPSVAGIPYPFATLNSMTYGMRTSESVLITAQEGVGKTELMHAILYQLLGATDDNVGAFFIEEPTKRLLQSLAGIKLEAPVHLPGCSYTDDQVLAAIQEVLKRDERLYVYSHFGSDDPDVLIDAIRFLVSVCGCRYILLDHITMAVTGLAGEQDERRALDYLTSRLEMMVVELDFCLIMVSHVNDFGQTRGSRNAAKVANTRIDCARDVVGGSDIIKLTISKNRFGQKTGPAGRYRYDPVRRLYMELPNEPLTGDNDNGHLNHQAA